MPGCSVAVALRASDEFAPDELGKPLYKSVIFVGKVAGFSSVT